MRSRLVTAIIVTQAIVGSPFGNPRPAFAQEQKTTAAAKTVWDGVYTSTQAQRGSDAYTQKCAGCHRDDLSGYQSVLKNETFMQHWREDNLESLFMAIKTTMPRGAPASLTDAVYLDILTFLLQANNFPPGVRDLTIDALSKITVEEKTGKSEVPAGTLIDVIGCLVHNSDNAWILERASEPVRTRDPDASAPEQLKASEAKPFGIKKFGLMDASAYHPDSQEGHKVEAKGFLMKDGDSERINLTALQMTDSTCGQ